MGETLNIDLDLILYALLAMFGSGLILLLLFLGWVIWRVRGIQLPEDADFLTALRSTPLSVVILLDLFDFSLDIFSVPFTWILLGYLGLKPLRGVTVVEAAIPGTQLLPTLTIAWIAARVINV